MEVKQIYELVNSATTQAIGQSDLLQEDLGNLVDVGEAIMNANSLDHYVKSLFDQKKIGEDGVIYDLYSGTGTIAQLLAPVANKVIGVEIVEEAVEAARENALRNGITNCEFIAGDVLKVLDDIEEKPDLIILDPPRDGVHPKALSRILSYGVDRLLYISCKPTSLARDLPMFLEAGYSPVRGVSVDQFPWTANVETIVLFSNQ